MSLTAEQRAAVVAEAMSWINTPYHHHARIKGVGVDCAHILCAVFENAGIVEHVDPGEYAVHWHLHRNEEVYQQWLERYCERVERPQPGDIALFQFGRTYSHSGILVEPDLVVHAYSERGVMLNRLTEEPLDGRPVLFWSVR